jgi:hypothetical protein
MKHFKFFQKEIKKFNVYEEMVLGMLEYCRNNAINPVGMSHPFVMTEITGVNHKRIVIRNVSKYGSPNITFINIEYDVHLRHHNDIDETVIGHTLSMEENELYELMDR